MDYKVWLIAFGVVAALLIGGSGFYAFSGYSKYSEEMQNWDAQVGTIESLERRVPYPNKANSEALAEKVSAYEESVENLFKSLDSFQRELNVSLESPEFLRLVSEKVQSYRKFSSDAGLEIAEASEFQMGFDLYSSVIPPQELVAVLDYELEAIDYLLRSLVEVGVSSLDSFERDPIPGESGAPPEQASSVVHKYPVRMRFTGSHDSIQAFINKLANDKEFFYIVRVLKILNEMTEGPPKLSDAQQSSYPRFSDPSTQEVASIEMLESWGYPEASEQELALRAGEEGFVSSQTDASVLMGQEKLEVFMVVDIVRFISPDEVAANAAKQAEEGDKRRTR
ncbi:MAG: Amuc_1100 family pilus-like protein [Verrucomicrobiota bacterium]